MVPERKSGIAPPVLLYGTCTIRIPAIWQNMALMRCVRPPLPLEPYEYASGFVFASAMNSATEFAGTDGCRMRPKGAMLICDTGTRLFTGSHGGLWVAAITGKLSDMM